MARAKGCGSALKEALFSAHFTDRQDISNRETLIALGKTVGLDETSIGSVLDSEDYNDEVATDIKEARDIGVRGVSFFVFNRKYAVSGTQPPEIFIQTLEKSFDESGTVIEGPTCGPDGQCD